MVDKKIDDRKIFDRVVGRDQRWSHLFVTHLFVINLFVINLFVIKRDVEGSRWVGDAFRLGVGGVEGESGVGGALVTVAVVVALAADSAASVTLTRISYYVVAQRGGQALADVEKGVAVGRKGRDERKAVGVDQGDLAVSGGRASTRTSRSSTRTKSFLVIR